MRFGFRPLHTKALSVEDSALHSTMYERIRAEADLFKQLSDNEGCK